jgi:hypothetical protein
MYKPPGLNPCNNTYLSQAPILPAYYKIQYLLHRTQTAFLKKNQEDNVI